MKSEPSCTYRIWMAGAYADAVRATREFCERGACVAIQATTYVYTGGAEEGICATLINYPRFPASPDEMRAKAWALAEHLQAALYQDSFSIEGPDETIWVSRRTEDGTGK